MKIELVINGTRHPLRPEIEVAHADGVTCECGEPLRVVGRNRTHGHDTHYADAHCAVCLRMVGRIEARVDTIFGIEEDRAVLHGRPRVY